MPIKFRCPKCRQAYSIASKKAGTSLRCQKCDAKMRIPTPEPAADEVAEASKPAQKPTESAPPTDDQPDLAAMRNLLDDDDDIGNDDFVDLSADELPTNLAAIASATTGDAASDGEGDDAVGETDEPAAEESAPESKGDSKPADDEDDDLAAVLAFEEALEGEDESSPAAAAPLPDELFAEDDDDEDEGWGRGRAGDDEEMDLTPMVDVTFLLLVFFMITASFSIQKTLSVPPPNPDEQGASQSQKIEDIKDQSVEVHIDSRNVISVDDEQLNDPSRLADIMRSKRMNEVLITAHENSLHDMLVKVIDAANEIGMQKIRVGITKGID
jgi:biopolymer transport protein ExbD